MNFRKPLVSFASVSAVLLTISQANATGLNDYNCKPAQGQNPVVLAHGQGGTPADMGSIIDALSGAGYCVFGEVYGASAAGYPGQAHLDQAGTDFGASVDKVLTAIGGDKVDVVGYSEGGMAFDNYVLAKGGASKVNRFVGFAPGHHPYLHFGLANVMDGFIFAPNIFHFVDNLLPPFTTNLSYKDVITIAMGVAGGLLDAQTKALVESDFVADLTDATYWKTLHGGLSEPEGTLGAFGTTVHSLPTKDSAPNICYTNMVSWGDTLVGASAGWTDPATNVTNLALKSAADHGTIINDAGAIATMLRALAVPCTPSANGGPADGGNGGGDASEQAEATSIPVNNPGPSRGLASESEASDSGGCSTAPGSSKTTFGGLAGLALAFGLTIARRRVRR